MSFAAGGPFVSRPAPTFTAGALALGVHALFALLLVFGVSWQTQPPAPVMVDLWEALPPAPLPRPDPPPPEPVPQPEVKPPEQPEPVVKEPPSPKVPDIALEKKKAEAERLKELKAKLAAEEKARAEEAKKLHDKELAEKKKRELLRQMDEEDLQRRVDDEARLAKQAEARAAAGKRQTEMASIIGEYRDRISAKVRGHTRLPDNLVGNPEVRCLVKLLPTGEVKGVRVTKSSGNAAYDEAVVRAIEKSSPLPLPDDRDARAAFVPELSFVHRPK